MSSIFKGVVLSRIRALQNHSPCRREIADKLTGKMLYVTVLYETLGCSVREHFAGGVCPRPLNIFGLDIP